MNEKMMNALEIVFQTLGILQKEGVKVWMKPSSARDSKEILDKYDNMEDRLLSAYWFHVELEGRDARERLMISDASTRLAGNGICFDTGGMGNFRDWEIDWSLTVEEHPNHKHVRDMLRNRGVMEDAINEAGDMI